MVVSCTSMNPLHGHLRQLGQDLFHPVGAFEKLDFDWHLVGKVD